MVEIADIRSRTSLLDGVQCLRLVAALLVVFTHSTFYAGERLVPGFPVWSRGTLGVDIFFVISGLVMWVSAGHLAGSDAAKSFLLKRAKRIVPLYWLITTFKLLILLAAPAVVLHAAIDWDYIAKSYFFIPAFNVEGKIEPLLGVGWTLIFEVFFYLIFALGLFLRVRLVPFVAVIMGICALISLVKQDTWPAWSIYFDFRVLEFLAGMLLGRYVMNWKMSVWLAAGLVGAGFAMILFGPSGLKGAGVLLTRLLPATAVVAGVMGLERHIRWPALLKFGGAASYSLYLVHPIVAPAAPVILSKLHLVSAPLSIMGSVSVALVAATAVYLLFEKPVSLILSKKFKPFWVKEAVTVQNSELGG
jgi:exopolysaccharide production protein ExoZ